MSDFTEMFGKLRDMQAKMGELQERLGETEIEGSAGGGLVSVRLNGKGEMQGVTIAPSLYKEEEAGVVEDLIVAAFNDAKAKVEQKMRDEMAKITGGLPLPPGMTPPI